MQPPATQGMRKTMRRPIRRLGIAALAGIATSAVVLLAGPAVAEGWAYDLAGELMSPYCPGRTLASCPSPQAAELVQWISLQESAGASRDQVVEMLVERFGEEILGAPPAKGITLWAYVLPIAGFVGFGGVALLVLRRVVAPAAAASPNPAPSNRAAPLPATAIRTAAEGGPAPASDDELRRRVEAELAERV